MQILCWRMIWCRKKDKIRFKIWCNVFCEYKKYILLNIFETFETERKIWFVFWKLISTKYMVVYRVDERGLVIPIVHYSLMSIRRFQLWLTPNIWPQKYALKMFNCFLKIQPFLQKRLISAYNWFWLQMLSFLDKSYIFRYEWNICEEILKILGIF